MQSTLKNRSIFCRDNLDILQGINSDSVDLIYLAPPFNKNKVFADPIGSSAEGAEFSDIFRQEDVKDEWVQTIKEDNHELYQFLSGIKWVGNHYNYCYLCYMAIRLIECYRVLKDTGSLYLHCDPTMSHFLKIVLDCVFEEKNFRNEIVWCYAGASESKVAFPRKHDVILFYAKTITTEFYFDSIRVAYKTNDNKPAKWKDGLHEKNVLGTKCLDWFSDIPSFMTASQSKEKTGYPTQKPLALLERIIKASSKEGDIVLDPFCGCATTCVAAEKLSRKWIGVDVSVKAYDIVRERLKKEVQSDLLEKKEVHYSTSLPKRTDRGHAEQIKKWVYVMSNQSYQEEYKVGVASNWQARLNSYQTSDPNRAYKLEFKIETPYFREIEQHIHQEFENRHEWVRAELKDIIKKIEEYKN